MIHALHFDARSINSGAISFDPVQCLLVDCTVTAIESAAAHGCSRFPRWTQTESR
ncbi:hypothetical protein [Glutamicibacter sp. MCAF14]|uniref:hypothetical protein n=1 Tax=Glutamicibacter sp. MCAF14 TaxID=3233043 RepID=UPI003F8EE032